MIELHKKPQKKQHTNLNSQELWSRCYLYDRCLHETLRFCKRFLDFALNHLSDFCLQPDDKKILCGDVNIDHSRESSRKTYLQNRLSCFGLECLNSNNQTRETEHHSSVIDVVYSKKIRTNTLETSITDHNTLTVPRVAIGSQQDRKTTGDRN